MLSFNGIAQIDFPGQSSEFLKMCHFLRYEFFMIRYDFERFVYIGKHILGRQVKHLLISILDIPRNNLAERNIDKY